MIISTVTVTSVIGTTLHSNWLCYTEVGIQPNIFISDEVISNIHLKSFVEYQLKSVVVSCKIHSSQLTIQKAPILYI